MSLQTYFKSNTAPGSILSDLKHFLLYMQENRFKVTGKKGLLPRHCLPVLNENMSRPLKLTLKREDQRAYPHINALYLLTRTLGLIHIEQVKNSRFLTANKEEIAAWYNLSEIDQYFSLMNAWFFTSDERLINSGIAKHESVLDSVQFLFTAKQENSEFRWLLKYVPLHDLALLEMFGLVNITDNNEPDSKWVISAITPRTYGKALMRLLKKRESDWLVELLDIGEVEDEFYQKLSAVIPQWKNCFKPKVCATNKGMHIFKLSLSKEVYRKISIPGTKKLDVLADVILQAFCFDDEHLYQFTYTDKFGVLKTIDQYYATITMPADELKIGDLNMLIGDSLEFVYDFGSYWRFDVKLEQIDDSIKSKKITLMESVGEAPEQYVEW